MDTLELTLRSAGGLLAVLGTVWLLTRVARSRAGAAVLQPGRRLRVLARVSVGRRSSVVTVDAGDRVLVLGVADGAVRLLAEQPALPDPEQPVQRLELPVGASVAPADPAARPDGPSVSAASPFPVPAPRSTSPLAGSLLDPGTWRSAVQVARDRTVRR
ncbi:FliO/MopB family protein [Aquipuribacter sp. SD81]|uniref:FliO/MopB family protein n=1 Tax=Aquipuribacter sp. SD81 TaxID=3127703 RepID=UPI00301A9463